MTNPTLAVRAAPRIFVSHSHVDNTFGIRIVQDLSRALGGDETAVWYDIAGGLHGGDAWWRKIVEEITARPIFVVVLSPDAMSSKWVNDEIDLAWQQKNTEGKLIVPILYRDCEIRADLRTRQVVSFLSPKTYDTAFAELVTALGVSSGSAELPPADSSSLFATDSATIRVRNMTPQIEAAFAAGEWLVVIDKMDFLARHDSSTAIPPALYRMQARAQLAQGNLARASLALDTALALDPLDVPTLRLAATTRVQLGRHGDALPLLQDALAMVNSPFDRLSLLRDYVPVLAALNEWSEVLIRCDEILRLDADDSVALDSKLIALMALDRNSDALVLVRNLTSQHKTTPAWWLLRAHLARSVANDTAEVQTALDAAAQLMPVGDPRLVRARADLLPAAAPNPSHTSIPEPREHPQQMQDILDDVVNMISSSQEGLNSATVALLEAQRIAGVLMAFSDSALHTAQQQAEIIDEIRRVLSRVLPREITSTAGDELTQFGGIHSGTTISGDLQALSQDLGIGDEDDTVFTDANEFTESYGSSLTPITRPLSLNNLDNQEDLSAEPIDVEEGLADVWRMVMQAGGDNNYLNRILGNIVRDLGIQTRHLRTADLDMAWLHHALDAIQNRTRQHPQDAQA